MKIVCATNIPFAEQAFGKLGQVTILPPASINAASLRDADALVTRSTTRVHRALLSGSRVRFVGTTTIGFEHLDLAYLQEAGIAWCAAPGCNANSVAEYLVAALLRLSRRHGLTLAGKKIGVIGVGNVGSLVVRKAEALGLYPLLNDPPRQAASGAALFRPLDEVLAAADIITLHVPAISTGPYPTCALANESFFARLKPGAIFINSARGAVMESAALLAALDRGQVAHAILDTWEDEPAFSSAVLARVDLGTPHIAGHSLEGKVKGTQMVYQELCRFLGVPAEWSPADLWPPAAVPELSVAQAGSPSEIILDELVGRVYDIEADDKRLRAIAQQSAAARARAFEHLRQNYPVRREFSATQVRLPSSQTALADKIRGIGFQTSIV